MPEDIPTIEEMPKIRYRCPHCGDLDTIYDVKPSFYKKGQIVKCHWCEQKIRLINAK